MIPEGAANIMKCFDQKVKCATAVIPYSIPEIFFMISLIKIYMPKRLWVTFLTENLSHKISTRCEMRNLLKRKTLSERGKRFKTVLQYRVQFMLVYFCINMKLIVYSAWFSLFAVKQMLFLPRSTLNFSHEYHPAG